MINHPQIGIQITDILLPRKGVDLTRWATIACDQFTSQPEYWERVKKFVGDAPSTYHMILPEVYLGTPAEKARVQSTQAAMHTYLDEKILVQQSGLIYVERSVDGKTRHGLMLALDLEQYDYNKGSQTLIRATEGTILDRLPPRMRIREGASIELPHILVLIDDPQQTVIEPVGAEKASLKKIYDFDLMENSGHLTGYSVNSTALTEKVAQGLERLADPEAFHAKYGVATSLGVLLFAVGDGNHSLATAKAIWEKMKPTVGMDHPSRYALVELENIHDAGLEFEPIHRVLFETKQDVITALRVAFGSRLSTTSCNSSQEMVDFVKTQGTAGQTIGVVTPDGYTVLTIDQPEFNLPVGTLQSFIDNWMKQGGAGKIDYVHGDDVVCNLGRQPGNVGFYLPAMPKSDLFKTVLLDGALPRKTFSMGEAHEKRFYMECRQIA
jgi:hypothetical protein